MADQLDLLDESDAHVSRPEPAASKLRRQRREATAYENPMSPTHDLASRVPPPAHTILAPRPRCDCPGCKAARSRPERRR